MADCVEASVVIGGTTYFCPIPVADEIARMKRVVEAARERTFHQGFCKTKWQPAQLCDCGVQELINALAALDGGTGWMTT